MDIRSLTLKNILIDDNKEEYFDLSVPSFDISKVAVNDIHMVTKDEEGRIDKIAESYYGSTDFIDILCFINRIYNPFSIKEGDLLVIPEVTTNTSNIYFRPEIPTWITGNEKNTTPTSKKTNEKDENRINRLKQQKAQRKPNELVEGQSVKKYINGKVILGTHLNTNNG